VSSQDDVTPSSTHDRSAANQGKTEPMPPTSGHGDPDAAPGPATVEEPDLASMSVGEGDPQAPSHPAAGPAGDPAHSGISADETPTGGPASPSLLAGPTGAAPRPQATTGTAFRQAGSNGTEGAEEQVDTAMDVSAARTNPVGTPGTAAGPGDASSVPVVSEEASPGTSENSAVAQGSRTPL
jgi:hypothetical protein